MEWYHVIAMTFGNIAWVLPMCLWMRSEGKTFRNKLKDLKEKK